MASTCNDGSGAVGGVATERRRHLPLMTNEQRSQIRSELLDVIEYRKSGLSANWIIGCPLDCGYCVASVADLGENALRMGLPILENHTWASTLWFMTRGISNEVEAWSHADVILVDRPVPDALGYYRAGPHLQG